MRTRLMTGLMGLALTLGASALVPKVALAAAPTGADALSAIMPR